MYILRKLRCSVLLLLLTSCNNEANVPTVNFSQYLMHYLPKTKQVVFFGYELPVKLLNLSNTDQIISVGNSSVKQEIITADGDYLLLQNEMKDSYELYQLSNQTLITTIPTKIYFLAAVMLPNQILQTIDDRGRVQDWSLNSTDKNPIKTIQLWRGEQIVYRINSAAFDKEGLSLVTAEDVQGIAYAWDIYPTTIVPFNATPALYPYFNITSVAIDKKNYRLLTGDNSGVVRLWEMGNNFPLGRSSYKIVLNLNEPIKRLAFNEDGTFNIAGTTQSGMNHRMNSKGRGAVMTSDYGSLFLSDIGIYFSGALTLSNLPVNSVAISKDTQTIVAGSADKKIYMIMRDGKHAFFSSVTQVLQGPTHEISSIGISDDGLTVAVGSLDRNVYIWNRNNQTENFSNPPQILSNSANAISSLSFSDDGLALTAGSTSSLVFLWERTQKNQPFSDQATVLTSASQEITSVVLSKDKRTLAAGCINHNIYVWNRQTANVGFENRAEVIPLQANPYITLSADGLLLLAATYGNESKIYAWQRENNTESFTRKTAYFFNKNPKYPGAKSLSLSEDGLTLATNINNRSIIFTRKNNLEPFSDELSTTLDQFDTSRVVSISADGLVLAIGNDEGNVTIYYRQQPHEPFSLPLLRGL